MSSSSARAISSRCSCPPLSWCGYLPSTSAGSSPTASRDACELRRATRPARGAEVARPDHLEHPVGLEDRVVRAERVLEDALHVPVVGAELATTERRHVLPVDRDRAGRDRRQPQDHPADGRLAAAALADQRDDLAALDRERHVRHGGQLRCRRTFRSGTPSSRPRARASGGHLPARGEAARRDLDERRLLDALLERQRAPVAEAAAGGRVEQRRRAARDPRQPLLRVAHADLGQRAEQQLACRDAADPR